MKLALIISFIIFPLNAFGFPLMGNNLSRFYNSQVSDFIQILNINKESYYAFTFNAKVPEGRYEQISEMGNETIFLDQNEFSRYHFGLIKESLYLVSGANSWKITNFTYRMFDNGMYYVPTICIPAFYSIDQDKAILMRKKAFKDYQSRHQNKRHEFSPLSNIIKLPFLSYHFIEHQWQTDLNGDGKMDFISKVNMDVEGLLYQKTNSVLVVTLSGKTNIQLYNHKFTGLPTLYYIPYHDYPVIKINYSSYGSGEGGDVLITFNKDSFEPIIIPIDFSYDM